MATRSLITLLFFLLLISSITSAVARADKDFIVFDVRKTLPLNENEKVYRDYYVDIGTESGVHAGTILSVYRRIPVIDVYRNKAQGDLVVPVGHLKVITSQRTMSVCRIMSLANESQIPVVQFETVMMGDRVEIAGQDTGPAKNENNSMGQAPKSPAETDAAMIGNPNSDSERSPATLGNDPVQTPQPAKTLPAKKLLKNKQAKPSVKALPIPAQT